MLKKSIYLGLAILSAGSVLTIGNPTFDRARAQQVATPTTTTPKDRPVPQVKPANLIPIIPTGTTMEADLQQEVTTGKNKDNDTFTLRIQNGSVNKYPILKDAVITGHLESVTKAARGKKAKLNLVFDEIKLKNGDRLRLNAQLLNTKIQGKTKGTFLRNAGIIVGGTLAGRFVGDKTKMKNGGLAGAAAATAYVLSSPGGEVVLKKGTDIELKLKSPLNAN
jgi:hypothetical protein